MPSSRVSVCYPQKGTNMDLPFMNVDLRTMYEETMASIKARLPKCANASVDISNRIDEVINKVTSLKNDSSKQMKYIEDNLYWLSKLNYQLKRLVA